MDKGAADGFVEISAQRIRAQKLDKQFWAADKWTQNPRKRS
jgi:hypothetical protein